MRAVVSTLINDSEISEMFFWNCSESYMAPVLNGLRLLTHDSFAVAFLAADGTDFLDHGKILKYTRSIGLIN